MSLTIRHAFDDERAAVAEFFHTLMNPNVPLALWNDLLDQRWTASPAPCAVIAEEKGRIVGALATVYADREIDGRAVRTSNLSGMYIEKSHRGVGLGRATRKRKPPNDWPASWPATGRWISSPSARSSP